jgi:hypothetical protein
MSQKQSAHRVAMAIFWLKLAQSGKGGGARPPPFPISTITYKVVLYAPAARADTLPLFLLYPYMYSVVRTLNCIFGCRDGAGSVRPTGGADGL